MSTTSRSDWTETVVAFDVSADCDPGVGDRSPAGVYDLLHLVTAVKSKRVIISPQQVTVSASPRSASLPGMGKAAKDTFDHDQRESSLALSCAAVF